MICSYALGNVDGMRRAFQQLIEVPNPEGEKEDDLLGEEDDEEDDHVVVQDDGLKDEIKKRQNYISR